MTGQTIVITRPRGDEQPLTDALHENGYRVIHEPLTEIILFHTEQQAVELALRHEPDAIIVTSRHGVQALSILTSVRDMYLICVGDATARTAASLGFSRTDNAGGTSRDIVRYVTEAYDSGSRFVYASGEHISAEIDSALKQSGMRVDRLVLYEAIASAQLSDTLIEQMRRGQLDAVTFFSPRSAQIFTSLVTSAEIQEAVAPLHAFCLSENIAQALSSGWKHVHLARQPTLASLIESIDNVFTAN